MQITLLTLCPLTFWGVEFVLSLLAPAGRMDVRTVGVYPEIMALGVAVKVQPHPIPAHLGQGEGEGGELSPKQGHWSNNSTLQVKQFHAIAACVCV